MRWKIPVTENQLIAAVGTVERLVGRFFRDTLPPLPVHLKEPAVRFVPWVCIITGALGLLVWLAGLGVIAFASAVTFWLEWAFLAPSEASILYGPVAAYFLQPVTLVFSLIGGLLMLGRNPGGWYLALLAELVNGVSSVLSFNMFGVLWSGLFLWVLFNIREDFTLGRPIASLAIPRRT